MRRSQRSLAGFCVVRAFRGAPSDSLAFGPEIVVSPWRGAWVALHVSQDYAHILFPMRLRFHLFVGLALAIVIASAMRAAPELDYNRDVRPILSEHCFACHGFDEKARKGKLRLDLAESAYAERNGLVRIKPGDPAASE